MIDANLFAHDLDSLRGNSGSPLLDVVGHVRGIHSSGPLGPEWFNFIDCRRESGCGGTGPECEPWWGWAQDIAGPAAVCHDGIKNFDESEIDCGGFCPACPPVSDEIVEVGGAAVLVAGPGPVDARPHVVQSNTRIYVWREAGSVATPGPIPFQVGGVPGTYDEAADLVGRGGTLPAGRRVHSHMIHYDPVSAGVASGFVKFRSEIIAVVFRCPELDAGDVVPWSGMTAYGKCGGGGPGTDTYGRRGLDWEDPGPNAQVAISPDRKQVSFTLIESGSMDNIRVLTRDAAAVPATSPRSDAILIGMLVIMVAFRWARRPDRAQNG